MFFETIFIPTFYVFISKTFLFKDHIKKRNKFRDYLHFSTLYWIFLDEIYVF
ncbi:hypothetical protein HMPREF3187_00900 [Aerococcus christensenii]|uniref:Uncharacterized protein n=1 Tax=Aerococcus christensenii TaxID=87541 RepID=A0A133XZR3_9LACT|nr:hypothetical protein HMPREF3187_00900 [Aerococcus christensenii]